MEQSSLPVAKNLPFEENFAHVHGALCVVINLVVKSILLLLSLCVRVCICKCSMQQESTRDPRKRRRKHGTSIATSLLPLFLVI